MRWVAEQLLGEAIFATLQWWVAKMLTGVGFFRNRRHLVAGVPFSSLLKDTSEVWAVWIAGNDARHNTLLAGKLRRLILPSPSTPWLKDIRVGGTSQTVAYATTLDEIRSAIQYARDWRDTQLRNHNVNSGALEIRWSERVVPNSLMIGFPQGVTYEWYESFLHERGWIQIDLAMNFMERGERPTIYYSAKRQPVLFDEYKRAFEALWKQSRPIPDNAFAPYEQANELRDRIDGIKNALNSGLQQHELLNTLKGQLQFALLNYTTSFCEMTTVRHVFDTISDQEIALDIERNIDFLEFMFNNIERFLKKKYL